MDKKEFKAYSIIAVVVFVVAFIFDKVTILNWMVGSIGWAALLGGTIFAASSCGCKKDKNQIRLVQFIWLLQILFIFLIMNKFYLE